MQQSKQTAWSLLGHELLMKRLLFIQSHPPHGTLAAQEGLDALLMGSAFVPCTVLFAGDGVFQLVATQQPEGIGRKDFARGFAALREYGVERLCVVAADLAQRGLTTTDLVVDVEVLDDEGSVHLLATNDVVLNF